MEPKVSILTVGADCVTSSANDAGFLICHRPTMRKLFVLCALLPCVAMLVGCPKKKDGTDGGEQAAAPAVAVVDAAPAAPAAPAAKNVNDVARFPAEKPVTDDDQKTVDLFASAKTGCKSGNNVALIKSGTDPFKIAEFQDCILVTFPDPKDAATSLMGWIPKAAFTLAAPRDAGVRDAAIDAAIDAAVALVPGKCPAGQESVVNVAGGAGVCRKKCAADKDCRTPTLNACAAATTSAGKVIKVCANELP